MIQLGGVFDRAGALRWSLRGSRMDGPVSLSGRTRRTRLDGGGWWEAQLGAVSVRTADHLRTLSAVQALLDQGIEDVVVSSCVSRTAPWPLDESGRKITSLPGLEHGDGTTFSDGSLHHDLVIQAELVGAAALRATDVVIRMIYGSALRGGEEFSVFHPEALQRRYVVRQVEDNGDGTYSVSVFPPMREVTEGEEVLNFERPECLMYLKDASGMDHDRVIGRYASVSPVFEEADF